MRIIFEDRKEAGSLLAKKLIPLKNEDVIVLGLPRGGVILASEIAFILQAPLDLIFAHKIGHPLQPEYAVAAISESGYFVLNPMEENQLDPLWLEREKQEALQTIQARRKAYLGEKKALSLTGKVTILVDDGIATGLTMFAAILEVLSHKPKKLIIAIPVAPQTTYEKLKEQVDEVISLQVDHDENFLGSVGSYYKNFAQVEDQEVINLLKNHL